MNDELLRHYNELFDDSDKIAAFDKIAGVCYARNFGSASKTELDTLTFSIYLDKLLQKYANKGGESTDFNAFSDYTISKQLGITQGKVASLKVRKELTYPAQDFVWQDVFNEVIKNARYDNKKIVIQIPDKNLYYEIKNAIELQADMWK